MTIQRQAPEPFSSLIDRVTAEDREWFERHPFTTERHRPYVDGEFWPIRHAGGRVFVVKVTPDMRLRQCDAPLLEPFDADEAAILGEHVATLAADLPQWRRP